MLVIDDLHTRVDDDLVCCDRLRTRDEVFDAGSRQVDKFAGFDELIGAAANFEEHGFIVTSFRQGGTGSSH